MLGQHPQLYDILETQLFEVRTLREWWSAYGEIHDSDGLARALAEILFGNQRPMAIVVVRQWLWQNRSRRTGEIAHLIADELFPLALVEKTPIESASEDVIRAKLRSRLQIFPKARFVHLVRSVVSYGISHLNHLDSMAKTGYPWRMELRYRMMLDETTDPPVIDPQVLWLRVNRLIGEFFEELPQEQKLVVRGEDLITDPDSALGRIARAFGLECDPQVIEAMKHPDRSPFACLGPKNAMFGGDPKFFRSPKFELGKPSYSGFREPVPWRQDGALFVREVIDLGEQFGYQ